MPLNLSATLVIAGGGIGGCAAALAALRNGLDVIMTEETDWIGGQLTSQGVPPDEHTWIETHGAPQSYRDYRNAVREYYKKNYPITARQIPAISEPWECK
jgi:NADPH-dependent 2,4-dienoyl-CoA reductase/sulfur reductase-like enzyme